MAKIKKKQPAHVKAIKRKAKLERQQKYETVFINGKQVRRKRQQMVEGVPLDQFIEDNADPIYLHQHGMWELIDD